MSKQVEDKNENSVLSVEDISILEDAKFFLNYWVCALNLQKRRIQKNTLSDLEHEVDIHFFIIALKRLRQSVLVGLEIDKLKPEISALIERYDSATEDVLQMRNVMEHIDEYIQNKGHNKNIKNTALYTRFFGEESYTWGNLTLDMQKANDAACELINGYRKITSREFKIYRNSE